MHRPDPRAGQHGNNGFGNHRHVNQDPIPLGHPLGGQNTGKARHLIAQLIIGVFFYRIGDRRIIDNRILIATAVFDVVI